LFFCFTDKFSDDFV